MEDVPLRTEAASHVAALGFSFLQKHGVGTKGPELCPSMVMGNIGICVCASSYSQATQANLWGPCMRMCLKGLQECCYCHCGSSQVSGSIYLNLRPIVASVSLFLSPVAECCVLTKLECRDPVSLHALTLYYLMI